MWLLARFAQSALFSLRSSTATSSGARTNLVPTMYAVKIGLVDAAFRYGDDGTEVFDLVKNLDVRFEPPRRVTVSNTFIKIQREPKDKKVGPAFIPSIAYREFCHFDGDLVVAIRVDGVPPESTKQLRRYLGGLNYLGKRGSFLQLVGFDEAPELRSTFGYVAEDGRAFTPDVILQYLDDMGPAATFDRISIFSDASARIGRDRILVPVALPFRRVSSSRGYTLCERPEQSNNQGGLQSCD
jgi:hypothetical protein